MSGARVEEQEQLANKTMCIATFTLKVKGERLGRTIYWRAILEYFLPRVHRLLYIEQPLSYADDKTRTMEVYQGGKLMATHSFPLPRALAHMRLAPSETSFRLKILDVVSTLFFLLRARAKVDFYVGIEPVNGMVGIILRRLGIAKTTIYCIMDYVPKRFDNPVMNGIFHALDRISVRFSDFAWNTCSMVETGRRYYDGPQKGATQLVVPVPCPQPYFDLESARGKSDIVFIGTLSPLFGVDLLLHAFRRAVKDVPSARLHVIGDGPIRSALEQYVHENNLGGSVRMYGVLPDKEADGIIAHSRIGVAPYFIQGPNSGFIYADNAKVKLYLAYGLPVIVSRLASSASIVENAGAGLPVGFSEEELVASMRRILTDDELYDRLHMGALNLASELRPDAVFGRAIGPALAK